jgi:hypothetical protein
MCSRKSFIHIKTRVPSERDLIQSLTTPLIKSAVLDEVGTRTVRLDWPPLQNKADTSFDSVSMRVNWFLSVRMAEGLYRFLDSAENETYLPLPSHISQSGHLTGFLGGSVLSSDDADESSVDIPSENVVRDGDAVGRITKEHVGSNATANKSAQNINANSLIFIILLERFNAVLSYLRVAQQQENVC